MNDFYDIQNAMISTWEAIGSDVLRATGQDSVPKDIVIEMVLDAGRLEKYGNFSEDELKVFNAMSFNDKLKIANKAFTFEYYGY